LLLVKEPELEVGDEVLAEDAEGACVLLERELYQGLERSIEVLSI
jgi:hypothetical protein